MKTTKGLKRAVEVTIGASMMLMIGILPAFAAGATVQDTEAVWGKPVSVQKLDNGMEKRFYKYNDGAITGFRYFVYRDGGVIGEGVDSAAPTTAKAEKPGLPVSELSRSYFQNHPWTVQDLEQIWGKPVAVRTLENGAEERVYSRNNAGDIGMRCYRVKDGKVVANSVVKVTGVQESKGELKGIPMDHVKDAGTETVAQIESIWGKPVGVKKLANGMEERYYKTTETVANRMFLFKEGKAVATTVVNYF